MSWVMDLQSEVATIDAYRQALVAYHKNHKKTVIVHADDVAPTLMSGRSLPTRTMPRSQLSPETTRAIRCLTVLAELLTRNAWSTDSDLYTSMCKAHG